MARYAFLIQGELMAPDLAGAQRILSEILARITEPRREAGVELSLEKDLTIVLAPADRVPAGKHKRTQSPRTAAVRRLRQMSR